MKNLNKLES